MRQIMILLHPDLAEIARKGQENHQTVMILKRSLPPKVNLILRTRSNNLSMNRLSMLEVNPSQHVAVPFNHGWMEAVSLLLSFLMVYHQLLQEVCDMVCCLVAHSSLIGNAHLQSSNASETFSLWNQARKTSFLKRRCLRRKQRLLNGARCRWRRPLKKARLVKSSISIFLENFDLKGFSTMLISAG
jgi:hypothetical protein